MASWIIEFLNRAGYTGLVFLMWLENIFPPIPSEIVMPLAGYHVQRGEWHFVAAVVAGTLGSLIGAYLFYWIGRRTGADGIKAFISRHGRWVALRQDDIDRSNQWFERHGGATVFICRLIPGLRSTISIPAGVAEQNLWAFTAYTVAGSALWCGILAYCGYLLGSRFESIGDYLNPVTWLVVGSLFVWYLWRVLHPQA